MSGYQLTPQACDDLQGIADYISQDNPRAALQVMKKIRETCRDVLAQIPGAGHRCDELAHGLRCFPIGNYVIFYRNKNPVEIIRIVHGARDIESLFQND